MEISHSKLATCFPRRLHLETVVHGMQIARPKLEMVVPYKQYKLVRGDGSAPERTRKHPFCMSRVHYSAPGHSTSLHKTGQPVFMSGWHQNMQCQCYKNRTLHQTMHQDSQFSLDI